MRELLAPLVPFSSIVIPHFSRRGTGPDHCLFEIVLVCLLDSRNGRGGYPVRPPVTCIDISHVAEKTLNFQVRWVIGGLPVQMALF